MTGINDGLMISLLTMMMSHYRKSTLGELSFLKRGFVSLLNALYSPSIMLRIGSLSLHVFTDAFGSIEENVFDSIYFTDEEIREADSIVDLGAHHCSFTVSSIVRASPSSTIVAVEPNPLAVKLCVDNVRALRWLIVRESLNVKILNRAVWDSEEVVDLEFSWWSEGHHVGLESYGDGMKVRTVTLNNILKLAKGKTIVKMDVEGAEYRVLKNADLRGVHMIAVEAHEDPYVIAGILRDHGFETSIQYHEIGKRLSRAWLKVEPRSYGLLVAIYRLIVSQIAKPKITIVKGIRI